MIQLDKEYVLKNGAPLTTPGAPLFVTPIGVSSCVISKEEVVRVRWQSNKTAWFTTETFNKFYEEL